MSYQENYIKQLHTLLRLVSDSVEGYKSAADHVSSTEYKDLFNNISRQREGIAAEFRELISGYGGNAEIESPDLMASLHRSWMGIKTAMTKKDDQAVMESCRNGDQALLDAFDDILQGDLLNNADLKTFIMDQRLKVNEVFLDLDDRYFKLFKKDPSI